MTLKLEVTKRDGTATEGTIPAVVYGPKQDSIALAVNKIAFDKLFKEAGESSIVELEGLEEPIEVLVQEVAFNPVKGGIRHIDFYAIERGKELTTNVPLEFVGEAPAEKAGGVLTKPVQEIEITCRPSNLPKSIVVDVSVLVDFESHIKISDLNLPDDVKVTNDLEDTVAVVVPVKEELEVEPEAIDMDAVEVEEKGKAESGESEKKEESEA